MSRQRLQAILDRLADRHWELVSTDEHPNASMDPFRLEGGEELTWAIRRSSGPIVELRFWATTALGERTNDLNDIVYCRVAAAPDLQLNFSKITSDEWRDDVQSFVFGLDNVIKRTLSE
jgi:hypothetical protein